jgi:hypothetical protein
MCQTTSEFSCGGAGASPRGISHYTDDSTIAATAMVGKSSTPRNRTATVRAAHAACIDRSGSCPVACTLRAASAQTSRLALRRRRSRVLGRRWPLLPSIAILAPVFDPPSLNAADLTEIWARYARSWAKVKFGIRQSGHERRTTCLTNCAM